MVQRDEIARPCRPLRITSCTIRRSRNTPLFLLMAWQSLAVRMALASAAALVHEAGMVIVGERHGTNEFPAFVGMLAIAAAREGRLIVALELADDARYPTALFVRSAGAVMDRQRLLRTPSWQRRDGRASDAMWLLVDRVRREIQAGAGIEVEAFDAVPLGDPSSDDYQIERERLLAHRLLEIRARGSVLVLTGNVHAEVVARPGACEGFVPMAALVAEHTEVVSLAGRHSGGEAWCTLPIDGRLVSAAHPVEGIDHGDRPYVHLGPPGRVRTGIAYVGAITPSPPAVGG